jgi:hypothetical protein
MANNVVLGLAIAVGIVFRFAPLQAADPRPSHWPSGARAVTVVDRTGDPGWRQATKWAVARWNEAGADIHLRWETAGAGDCSPAKGRIEVCSTTYEELNRELNIGLQGLASADPPNGGGHRTSAEVTVCSDCDLSAARRRLVATHELGHTLGLSHSTRAGSVMFHSGGSDRPDAADAAALRAVYAHADKPGPCGLLHLRLGSVCL